MADSDPAARADQSPETAATPCKPKISETGTSRPRSIMFFRKRYKQPTGPPTDALSQLPTEILQKISDFLPISSRAALSLANKTIRTIIGPEYTNLASNVEERSDFLALLEPNFRYHFLCRPCGALHTRKRFDHYDTLRYGPWPATCFKNTTAQCFGSNFTLHFHHLYLVMQQHRLGSRYGIGTDRLAGHHRSSVDLNCKLDTKTRGRITATGDLVLRCKYLYFRPKPKAVNWREGDITTVYALKICPHQSVWEYAPQRGLLSEAIKCLITHSDEASRNLCTNCVSHKLCLYCPTEFEVSYRTSKKKGLGVLIVSWTNLGKGQTLDDPTWKAVSTPKKHRSIQRSPPWQWQERRPRDEFNAVVAKEPKKKKNQKNKSTKDEQEKPTQDVVTAPVQSETS